jgi:hypothetical protein
MSHHPSLIEFGGGDSTAQVTDPGDFAPITSAFRVHVVTRYEDRDAEGDIPAYEVPLLEAKYSHSGGSVEVRPVWLHHPASGQEMLPRVAPLSRYLLDLEVRRLTRDYTVQTQDGAVSLFDKVYGGVQGFYDAVTRQAREAQRIYKGQKLTLEQVEQVVNSCRPVRARPGVVIDHVAMPAVGAASGEIGGGDEDDDTSGPPLADPHAELRQKLLAAGCSTAQAAQLVTGVDPNTVSGLTTDKALRKRVQDILSTVARPS